MIGKILGHAQASAAALDFTKNFFTGDAAGDPKSFDGLERRLTGSQVLDANGDELALDLLDELIDAVAGSPDVLFMNKNDEGQGLLAFQAGKRYSENEPGTL